MNSLGERLYELRTKNEMSQGDLAEKLDVSRQTISKWENNMSIPELDKIISLSNLFGVSVDYIVKGEGDTSVISPQFSEIAYENTKEPEPVRMIRVDPTEKYVSGMSIALGILKLVMVLYSVFVDMRQVILLESSSHLSMHIYLFIATEIIDMFICVALLSRRKNILSAALITQAVYSVACWFIPSSGEGEKIILMGISSVLMLAAVFALALGSTFSNNKNAKPLCAITIALFIIQFAVRSAAYGYIYIEFSEMTTRGVVISVFNTFIETLPILIVNIGIAVMIYFRANPKPVYEVAENAYPAYSYMYVGSVVHILLSLFTLGIYNCIWICKTTEVLNCGKNEIQSGTKKLLLCILVPFYRLYWYYNQSKRLENLMKERDSSSSEFAVVTLILAIFVPIVAASTFLQVKINEYAKK
ncbi:MAG: helix-turn-helix domain-containing protein [Clostridia bacterium]|nr:helix-turn-helix domain-containing protein [Clostridia bacterium]